MLNTQSDYALNKVNKAVIVCSSVTGEHIRLDSKDFTSEEEFERWKTWSDDDYHKIELASRKDDACLSFEAQWNILVPSAEEVYLAPHIAAEQLEQRHKLLEQIKSCLTKKQYRRLCLYYLGEKTEAEIAALEGVGQRRISASITSGAKNVRKFFTEILCR